jgi:hypothetical protein
MPAVEVLPAGGRKKPPGARQIEYIGEEKASGRETAGSEL